VEGCVKRGITVSVGHTMAELPQGCMVLFISNIELRENYNLKEEKTY
jgi:hypothetical protein